ncbi:MAG: FMN-binding glutamate synthase family protein [Myxococcota bacterium]|jgi:glutamate synthase domain-containing protein 2|nr:FMN-binding glutamate synthase family protein [Myxococcota bacterium]
MKAFLNTGILIVVSCLAVLTWVWPPALFAFLLVGPLAALSVWGLSGGELSARDIFVWTAVAAITSVVVVGYFWPVALLGMLLIGPIIFLGAWDMSQTRSSVRRNFPVIGHMRYLLEEIRPEIQQYFIESNTDGRPFAREDRNVVYQRSKGALDTLPFGTQRDVYATGYEWINHSMAPCEPDDMNPRVMIGEGTCEQPYDASILNISAMSFGALSGNAIEALNIGAREGGFAHNTGEGAISPHHLQGGDLIWQIGTGYFGCRTQDGRFDAERFVANATRDAVKMIEIKISQGAKPGHGGILPAAKITPEIAEIRGVPLGADVISPPAHTAFTTPTGLLEFVARLRELSGGKPVGFKLCVGKRREFLAVCKAMIETGLHPDFIAVDGGEGGTGAAPVEFSNSLGCPLVEGLTFVHSALLGAGVRDKIKIIASGKVASGFGVVKRLALGADLLYAARSMMMSMGCIQARQCNANTCPVGIATQNPNLTKGLVVSRKSARVALYHEETVGAAMELIAAAGLTSPSALEPWYIMRRVSPFETRHYGEIIHFLDDGALLGDDLPLEYERAWVAATASSFEHAADDDVHA